MAFSDEDLQGLSDEFVSLPDDQIVTPRAFERRRGGNAGFSQFARAVDVPEHATEIQPRKCRRCKEMVDDGGGFCLRHRELRRLESNARSRKLGMPEWHETGKGRPPDIVRRAIAEDVDVKLAIGRLNDAHAELAALKHRIARLKRELTQARNAAVESVRGDLLIRGMRRA